MRRTRHPIPFAGHRPPINQHRLRSREDNSTVRILIALSDDSVHFLPSNNKPVGHRGRPVVATTAAISSASYTYHYWAGPAIHRQRSAVTPLAPLPPRSVPSPPKTAWPPVCRLAQGEASCQAPSDHPGRTSKTLPLQLLSRATRQGAQVHFAAPGKHVCTAATKASRQQPETLKRCATAEPDGTYRVRPSMPVAKRKLLTKRVPMP